MRGQVRLSELYIISRVRPSVIFHKQRMAEFLRPVPDLLRCCFLRGQSLQMKCAQKEVWHSGTGRQIPPLLASLFGREVLLQIYIELTGLDLHDCSVKREQELHASR